MKNNHDRTLSEFQNEIDELKANGFNPIAVSQMYMEDTFVFETKDEATKAYRQFERDENEKWIGKIVGWFYSKDDFLKAVDEYENSEHDYLRGFKVLTYWL